VEAEETIKNFHLHRWDAGVTQKIVRAVVRFFSGHPQPHLLGVNRPNTFLCPASGFLNNRPISFIYSRMKLLTFASTVLVTALSLSAAETVRLSKVHLCCNACVRGVEKAVAGIAGVTAVVDKEGGVVALQGEDAATVQKGIDTLVNAGYFGVSDHASLKPKASTGAPAGKVQKLTIEGVHLCCGSCVKAVNGALTKVKGVKAHTAEKNAKTFEVTGDFVAADVLAALHKAGLSGRVAK
jgi:copper chaperone CopZ